MNVNSCIRRLENEMNWCGSIEKMKKDLKVKLNLQFIVEQRHGKEQNKMAINKSIRDIGRRQREIWRETNRQMEGGDAAEQSNSC